MRRAAIDFPLRFTPFLRPMIWGGRRLESVLHKRLPTNESYGEAWDVSDHPLHRSVIASGPRAGQTLRQLMEQERGALLGPAAAAHAAFPWLVKFLDANDWLSVQVHPNAESVQRLWPGEGSKTEAWFVLASEPGSRIYAGLLPGVDEARLRATLASGTVVECLHQFTPQPGDCIFLPAGTVHAVGGGVLMTEVQQTSDATFRLFDWNRRDAQGKSRTLHIEESLAAIDWSRGPVQPIRASGWAQKSGIALPSPAIRQSLVKCPFFELDYVEPKQPATLGGQGRLQLLIVLRGSGKITNAHGEESLGIGQAWVLPAEMTAWECRPGPELAYLHCTLP